jgi:aspartate aminotransferase-like enzyme
LYFEFHSILTSRSFVLLNVPRRLSPIFFTMQQLPAWTTWKALDEGLRAKGVVVGGSYGPLANNVFRIGHMGSQADLDLVRRGLDVLQEVVESLKAKIA